MRLRLAVAIGSTAAITAIGLAGCTSSSSTPPPGRIVGTAQPCVGPAVLGVHFTVAYVSVSQGPRTIATRKNLASPYEFAFTVAPGTYRVTAPSDGSVQVKVESGRTATVALYNSCI